MADDERSSSDESLDPTSEKFDPLKALYSQKARIPAPEAAVYDNLAKFESVVLKGQPEKVRAHFWSFREKSPRASLPRKLMRVDIVSEKRRGGLEEHGWRMLHAKIPAASR